MQLILVRHGKPDEQGSANPRDPGLDENGIRHAESVAHVLAGETLTHIVSSPLQRAIETAQPLADLSGLSMNIHDGWAEADKHCERYRSMESLRGLGKDEWQRFMQDPIRYLGADPLGFRNDVLAALQQCMELPMDSRVAIFTHGMVINTVLSHTLGLQSLTHFYPGYGSITRLGARHRDKLGVISVNELGHQRT